MIKSISAFEYFMREYIVILIHLMIDDIKAISIGNKVNQKKAVDLMLESRVQISDIHM